MEDDLPAPLPPPPPPKPLCPICLEEFTIPNAVKLPNCRHWFCRSCITRWRKHEYSDGDDGDDGDSDMQLSPYWTCPVCRESQEKKSDDDDDVQQQWRTMLRNARWNVISYLVSRSDSVPRITTHGDVDTTDFMEQLTDLRRVINDWRLHNEAETEQQSSSPSPAASATPPADVWSMDTTEIDISLILRNFDCTRDDAMKALQEADGNVVAAILNLDNRASSSS